MKTLIVEDEFTGRLLLQEFLRIYGPAHIAANGREAVEAVRLARAAGAPYDLVCMDIKMPEMDGMEALRHIRADEEAAALAPAAMCRIIMTTSVDDIKKVFAAYRSLCDGYIIKPVAKEKLTATLRELKLIL
jgi:two-component system chemotaxis response regulator CheY